MEKRANRILSVLIALVMVLSMLPAAVFATGETANVLEGWNITLGDNIGVKFHLNSADYTVTTTVNGAEVIPTISDKVVTVNVAAAQMNDKIVLTVKNGEEVVHTDEYSVREYAETILGGEYDGYVKDMVKEMLNYGAAAQTYFDYNADNLANAGYELESSAEVPTEVPAITVEDKLAGISLYGMSLVFRNKTAVRFYFQVSGDIANYTFSQGTPVEKDGKYYVEIGDINPQNLADDITLNVNDGALSVTYSPLNYIVRKYNNADSSEALKNLVQAMYGYHLEAKYYNSVVPVGALQSSGHGWSTGGIYAVMPENNAYFVQDDWAIEYTPVSADVIKLVRGGETTSVGVPGEGTLIKFTATDYYLKTAGNTISGDVLPLQDQDYLIVEGRFYHPATGSVMYISKTYLYNNGGTLEFSTTEPVLPVSYDVGVLQAHNAGAGGSGIYFTTQEVNDAPYGDWNTYYDAASLDCVKLVRDGETISIALTDKNTICKFGANDYYLRLENWTIGDYAPFTTDDMFIVEGAFTHKSSKTTLNIAKTYIYHDGSAWVFSATEPIPEVIHEIGVLAQSNNGTRVDSSSGTVTGVYAVADANDAPYSDWSIEYTPAEASGFKLIRDGVTYDVGVNGSGTIVKFTDRDYFVKLEGHTIKFSDNSAVLPMQDNDILIIEGNWVQATDPTVKVNFAKTYILLDGTTAVFSATEPVFPTVYEIGILNSHGAGVGKDDSGNIKGVYATAVATDATYNGDWSVEYTPASAENYKLIRDGVTYNFGYPGQGTMVMFSQTEFYLKQEGHTVADSSLLPMQDGDILVLEGQWNCNQDALSILNITKTYILLSNGTATFSATEPVLEVVVSGGNMSENEDGWDAAGDIFFSLTENDVPVDENAEIEYTAETGVIKLVRNETTYDMVGTVVKYGDTAYYLNLSGSENLPLQDNDYLIVEGNFTNAGNGYTLSIAKTYILVDGESLVYSTTEPDLSASYDVGVLQANVNGHTYGGSGIYFSTQEVNDAPYGDWNTYYDTASVDCLKLVRDGETISIGLTGRNTICKFGTNDYYLRLENWTIGDYAPFTTDDMFIVEGAFTHVNSNTTLNITKTYVYYNGSVWVFSATEPVEEVIHQIGVLAESGNGTRVDSAGTVTGVYAVADVNDAPYSDWSIEYTPADASGLKLIRGGVTYNVGVNGSGTIVKFTDRDYFVKLEGHTIKFSDNSSVLPMQDGDILIIEGSWVQATDPTVKVSFTKTYILLDGTTAVFSATEPVVTPVYEVGVLAPHSAGVNVDATAGIKGIYATCAATDATYNGDWTVEYSPVSAENYKLIRGGTTYNVGVPGAGTLVLFSQTDIYLKQEAHTIAGDLLPLQDGDILVVEGEWSCNQDANSIINITKTYISISGNSAVFSAEDPRIINVGTMYAHEAGFSGGDTISGIYFMTESNAVPANEDWSVRYAATDASNVKLIRGGTTQNIAVVGANTIVKMSDQAGWLCLENASIISTYPIVAGDVLVVEGAFSNASNGYTMVIEKTYIVVGSDGVSFTTQYEETDYGTVILPTSVDTLTIGTWAGSYHHFTDERLAELKAAGITKLIGVNPAYVGSENNNDVAVLLDRCAKYGICVVIDLRDWDGSTVPSYASHPNMIGFLMYDEPNTADFETLATLKTQFDAVMPADKLFYVNLFPECAADSSLGELTWWDELVGTDLDYDEDYVTAFLNALDIEVLSWDNYSLLEGSGIRTDYYHNFEVMASKNLPLWYTMLSAGHGTTATTYATPTAAELRWQMAVAMTYGVQNIDHYVYYSHESDYTCMLQCVDGVYSTTALYDDILAVDNEYLAWDNIFMAYDWVGVGVHNTGSGSSMLTALENSLTLSGYGIAATSASENLLIGVFENNGNKAYMVTNAGSAGSTTVGDGKNFSMNDTTVTLTLTDADYKCVAVIDNGEISYVAVNADNTVTLNVQAYEGVFVIPVLN